MKDGWGEGSRMRRGHLGEVWPWSCREAWSELQQLPGAQSELASQLPGGSAELLCLEPSPVQLEGGSRERKAEASAAGQVGSGAQGAGRGWLPTPGAGCLPEPCFP